MEGIASTIDQDPKKALLSIDKHFDVDHERLITQHHLIASKFGKNAKYIYSGDELFILPDHYLTYAEKKNFISEIAKDPEANHIRTGFSTIDDTTIRSQTIASGDKLESAIRESLQGKIPMDQLLQINIGMNISETEWGIHVLTPIVSERGLTADQKAMTELTPKYAPAMVVRSVQFVP